MTNLDDLIVSISRDSAPEYLNATVTDAAYFASQVITPDRGLTLTFEGKRMGVQVVSASFDGEVTFRVDIAVVMDPDWTKPSASAA